MFWVNSCLCSGLNGWRNRSLEADPWVYLCACRQILRETCIEFVWLSVKHIAREPVRDLASLELYINGTQ
jgi:hypothetical protein